MDMDRGWIFPRVSQRRVDNGDINGMFHILSILVTITTWHVKYFFIPYDSLRNEPIE